MHLELQLSLSAKLLGFPPSDLLMELTSRLLHSVVVLGSHSCWLLSERKVEAARALRAGL